MRVHFDYNPRQDRLIPSQDAGMPFRVGDIIKILNQEDSFWWQVGGAWGVVMDRACGLGWGLMLGLAWGVVFVLQLVGSIAIYNA